MTLHGLKRRPVTGASLFCLLGCLICRKEFDEPLKKKHPEMLNLCEWWSDRLRIHLHPLMANEPKG